MRLLVVLQTACQDLKHLIILTKEMTPESIE